VPVNALSGNKIEKETDGKERGKEREREGKGGGTRLQKRGERIERRGAIA